MTTLFLTFILGFAMAFVFELFFNLESGGTERDAHGQSDALLSDAVRQSPQALKALTGQLENACRISTRPALHSFNPPTLRALLAANPKLLI